MRSVRAILLACSFFALAGQTVPARAEDGGNREIIVTGKPLNETESDLKACIARGCPPDEEIRLALAHAENQFITGEYRDAKSTLYRTVGRNRKYSADYPIEVSDLFRARSRVAEHLGEADDFRLAVLDMRDVLRTNLPENDARAMVAQIEVGESRSKLGYPKEAIRIFTDIGRKAEAAGHHRVAAYARLRRYLIEYDLAVSVNAVSDGKRALAGLRSLANSAQTGTEDLAMVAEVTLARLDRRSGNQDSTAAIIKRFAERGGAARPILLSSEPVKMPQGHNLKSGTEELGTRILDKGIKGAAVFGSTTLPLLPGVAEDRWIDVGFWINPNGLVVDIEILRSSGEIYWAKWVADSIKSRIYAPLSMQGREASPGFYMVERYSYTARYLDRSATTGSRIATRSPNARIERLDLTPENYDQPFVTPPDKSTD